MAENEKKLGAFVIEEELGQGGMGVVFLGRHTTLERPVVLKKLRREIASSAEGVERFQREARAAAAIHHPNVVAVYDCFTWRGDPYIAQEFVDGVDLRVLIERCERIPPRMAGLITLEIARGLEEIHARGTVHRDLKPANVLIGRRGEVKIADFGIVLEPSSEALTEPGMMIGSPPYMPPEQMLGDRVDPRGDLFSLGVVCYEMLAGKTPYGEPREGRDETLLHRMQRERYPSLRRSAPDSPRYLRKLTRALLRARPKKRLASTTWLRRTLEIKLGRPSPAESRAEIALWLSERSILPAPQGQTVCIPCAEPPQPRRHQVLRWGGAVVVCAAILATLFITGTGSHPILERASNTLRELPGLLQELGELGPDSGGDPGEASED